MPPEETNITPSADAHPQQPSEPAASSAPASDPASDIASLPAWAQKLIREQLSEAAQRRTELRDLQDRFTKTEQERLAQSGQWQTLAEQRAKEVEDLKAREARGQAAETAITESNNRRIAALPESSRALVPMAYDPLMLSKWLDQAGPMLAQRQSPDLNAGVQGETVAATARLTTEQIAIAKRMNITPAQYAANLRAE